jgi:hypothetical protein
VSVACQFLCHSLSKTSLANHHSMPHGVPVRPQTRYFPAPRETKSTLV